MASLLVSLMITLIGESSMKKILSSSVRISLKISVFLRTSSPKKIFFVFPSRIYWTGTVTLYTCLKASPLKSSLREVSANPGSCGLPTMSLIFTSYSMPYNANRQLDASFISLAFMLFSLSIVSSLSRSRFLGGSFMRMAVLISS